MSSKSPYHIIFIDSAQCNADSLAKQDPIATSLMRASRELGITYALLAVAIGREEATSTLMEALEGICEDNGFATSLVDHYEDEPHVVFTHELLRLGLVPAACMELVDELRYSNITDKKLDCLKPVFTKDIWRRA